jgi:tetratricopeptide (TPR) repeat protein
MTRILALAASALLLCATPARAAEPSLKQAQALYDSLDYPGAIEAARRALARGGNGPAEVRALYELLGSALAIVGQTAEAGAEFRRLLALDPQHRLADGASPKIQAPFAKAQDEARGARALAASHAPPARARHDRALPLVVKVANDPLRMARTVRVVYRLPGEASESSLEAVASVGAVVLGLALPALGAHPGQLRYRVELLDRDGNVLLARGTAEAPFAVALESAVAEQPPAASPWYRRWWVWTIVGVVAAGATTAAVLATRSRGEEVSDLRLSWSARALRW